MSIEKRLNSAALIKGATWGTAAQAGAAGCGITPLNPGVPQFGMSTVEIDEIKGSQETGIDMPLITPSDFGLDFQYQWDGLENILLAMLMGTAGAPAQQAATTAYLHTLTLKDSVAGIFGTYAVQKEDKIHVVPSFKVLKWTLTMANGMIKSSFNLRGNKVTDADAVVTSLASVTYPAIHNRAQFNQAVFRLNAQTGADLDSGSVVLPKGFSLEVERKMDSEHTAGSMSIIEPRENAKIAVKLTMDFSRMDATNAAWLADWLAGTEKKGDITITGPLIASTYYYYLKMQMPRLKIENVDFPDAAIIPAKVTMRALKADAAPTGMALTDALTVTVMNKRTTDLLA